MASTTPAPITFAGSIQPAGSKNGTEFRQPAMFARKQDAIVKSEDGAEVKKSTVQEYVRKPREAKIKLHSDVTITKKEQKKINKLRPKITWHEGRGEKDKAKEIMLQIQAIYVAAEEKDRAWQKS